MLLTPAPSSPSSSLRHDGDLTTLLEQLIEQYFADYPLANPIQVRFGRYSRTRLGSIGLAGWRSLKHPRALAYPGRHLSQHDQAASQIVITGYYRHRSIPDRLILATLAHELVHYFHGFHSALPQKFLDPHRGNIVDQELYKVGFGQELRLAKSWQRLHLRQAMQQIDSEERRLKSHKPLKPLKSGLKSRPQSLSQAHPLARQLRRILLG
ncbi:MAG: hypothetical protein CEO22_670 [Candidatus Berkelbacteria bacterium Gr01-1014_85]|uniref:Uncharacterized protein n=1 Tax=Candidatus Berkelbacteria bacterium Gr01-1014_85 TaxID=2017150 RepID=A0A554J946_9BACT|nr:MAG: hypothetical protein CEO22_670 [Candidatus Berkelbacteria bacterium Gr01-1014_85]